MFQKLRYSAEKACDNSLSFTGKAARLPWTRRALIID